MLRQAAATTKKQRRWHPILVIYRRASRQLTACKLCFGLCSRVYGEYVTTEYTSLQGYVCHMRTGWKQRTFPWNSCSTINVGEEIFISRSTLLMIFADPDGNLSKVQFLVDTSHSFLNWFLFKRKNIQLFFSLGLGFVQKRPIHNQTTS